MTSAISFWEREFLEHFSYQFLIQFFFLNFLKWIYSLWAHYGILGRNRFFFYLVNNCDKFLDTHLHKPAFPSATSLLQIVSTKPDGDSFCSWIGHLINAFAPSPAGVFPSVSKMTLFICESREKICIFLQLQEKKWRKIFTVKRLCNSCGSLSRR